MKKFLVLSLVFTAMAAGFAPKAQAQFSWKLDSGLGTGLLTWSIPTGERAQKSITFNGTETVNSAANNPVNDRGNYTYNSGGLDVFTYGRRTWLRPNELRLNIDFKGQATELHTRTLLDPLVANVTTNPSGQNSTTGDHSLVMGSGNTPNWNDILRFSFDEYYLKGSAGYISGVIGNTPDRGKVTGFNEAFTDDVLKTVMVEYYGVNTPAVNADFSVNGQDVNNFRTRPSWQPGTPDNYDWVMPYLMLGAQFFVSTGDSGFPLSIQLAADPGNNTGIPTGDGNFIRFNGSVRVSAERIADWVTVEAIYRFRGGDPNKADVYDETYNTGGVVQPDGSGTAAHVFGLYANILKVPNFGIGLGYSGYLVSYEDTKDKDTGIITATTGPLYNGIDLRLQYTGLKNITITFNNNISYTSAGPSTVDAVSKGVLGTTLDRYSSQSWLGLYNALGLDWHVGEKLTASFQIGSRFGLLATNQSIVGGGVSTVEKSLLQLGGGAYVIYQWNRYVAVRGGLAFRYQNDSYTNDAPGSQNVAETRNASGGSFDIAIPVMVNITFGK